MNFSPLVQCGVPIRPFRKVSRLGFGVKRALCELMGITLDA